MVEKTDLIWVGLGVVAAYFASKQFPGIVPKSMNVIPTYSDRPRYRPDLDRVFY